MKKNRKAVSVYLVCTLLITAIAVALRSVALIKYYNPSTGYFSEKVLINIANWLVAAVVLGAVSYIFVADKKKKYVATYRDATTYIPSALVALALVFIAVDLVSELMKPLSSTAVAIIATNLFAITLAIVGAVAFVASCLLIGRRNATRGALQIAAILFFAVYAAYVYFENPYPLNAPCRVADISAYLSATVFILYETRISLGRDIWNLYTAFGLITVSTCAYSSIPTLIKYFTDGQMVSRSLAEAVLTLTLFIFAAMRLVRSLYLFEEREAKTVVMIKELEEAARAHAHEIQNDDEVIQSTVQDGDNGNYTIELSDTAEE